LVPFIPTKAAKLAQVWGKTFRRKSPRNAVIPAPNGFGENAPTQGLPLGPPRAKRGPQNPNFRARALLGRGEILRHTFPGRKFPPHPPFSREGPSPRVKKFSEWTPVSNRGTFSEGLPGKQSPQTPRGRWPFLSPKREAPDFPGEGSYTPRNPPPT